MLTYLLDTSAWLTHVFNEPGCQRINTLFDSNDPTVGTPGPVTVSNFGAFKG